MSSRVCATGHIQDPIIEKSQALCPNGRCPPSFIHQVISTGLNKLYDCIQVAQRVTSMHTSMHTANCHCLSYNMVQSLALSLPVCIYQCTHV